jgi:deazaflavin-dependent oxidoreductase (nitroreductase family)
MSSTLTYILVKSLINCKTFDKYGVQLCMGMKSVSEILAGLKTQDYCYLTTKGRVSGKPHRIEIWFGVDGDSIFLLSGGGEGSDWVKNLKVDSNVQVRIAKQHFTGVAEIVSNADSDAMARRLLAAKYYGWSEGKKFNDWASTALPVKIKLQPA